MVDFVFQGTFCVPHVLLVNFAALVIMIVGNDCSSAAGQDNALEGSLCKPGS